MRLILPIPENCPRRDLDADRSLVVLEGTEERPVVTLLLYHPHIPPMAFVEYASDMTRKELPEGTVAEMKWARTDKNHGWWTQVVHTSIERPGEAAPRELRLSAIYGFETFQTFVAGAVARVHDPSRFEELRPRLEQLLKAGRPDWTDASPPSLAELYD